MAKNASASALELIYDNRKTFKNNCRHSLRFTLKYYKNKYPIHKWKKI